MTWQASTAPLEDAGTSNVWLEGQLACGVENIASRSDSLRSPNQKPQTQESHMHQMATPAVVCTWGYSLMDVPSAFHKCIGIARPRLSLTSTSTRGVRVPAGCMRWNYALAAAASTTLAFLVRRHYRSGCPQALTRSRHAVVTPGSLSQLADMHADAVPSQMAGILTRKCSVDD